MSIRISKKLCMSWIDPEGGPRLAHAFQQRLEAKLDIDSERTANSRFITLSYDREPYGDQGQFDLWNEAQRGDGHLKLFWRRLSRRLKRKFSGKWVAKKEFQEGGWLHWHILLYDCGHIDHQDITEAWGKGYAWISKVDKKSANYLAKYQAKCGAVPGWLYDMPGRSLKFIQSSPGFWAHEKEDEFPKPKIPRTDYTPKPYKPQQPLWMRIELARQMITIRSDKDTQRTVQGDYNSLLIALRMMGCKYEGKRFGQVEFAATYEDVKRAMDYYVKPCMNQNNVENQILNHTTVSTNYKDQKTAWGGVADPAVFSLLDTTHKNRDTDENDHSEPDQLWDEEPDYNRFQTQVEFYGWAQLACIDRQYVEEHHHVHELMSHPDYYQGEILPF